MNLKCKTVLPLGEKRLNKNKVWICQGVYPDVIFINPAGTSIDSDKCDSIKRLWYSHMIFYNGSLWEFFKKMFQANLRNQEIVYQHNITEKYYEIGRSKLRWDI